MNIELLFNSDGNMLLPFNDYFNEEGKLIYVDLIDKEYTKFPANSDIVAMRYADLYSTATKYNYDACTLFNRI